MKELLSFDWGDTRGIREILSDIYSGGLFVSSKNIKGYGYPPAEGKPELVRQLRSLTKRLTGIHFEYICLTAGCTHAINAAVTCFKNRYITYKIPYYPLYPKMFSLLNKTYVHNNFSVDKKTIVADSPSNPLGIIGLDKIEIHIQDSLIWDGAYHSPTYGMKLGISPFESGKVNVFCGSISKLLGLNGLRIGWTATNTLQLHEDIVSYVKDSICGITLPAQDIIIPILEDRENLEKFFMESALLIQDNKEELLKLKNFFGSDNIPEYGMFGFFEVDNKMLDTINNARVVFTDGKDCGCDSFVRINLGNTREMTKEMVNRILKEDGRKK